MTKGEFKCTSCNRTFAMAAHLARHKNSMHRRGRGRPAGPRKGARGGRLGRPPLSKSPSVGTDDDSRVLSEMVAYRDTLLMQRSNIDRRLEGIENAMNAMDSYSASVSTGARRTAKATRSGGGKRGRRPGRPGSLKVMIVKVLRQRAKALSPQEIADGVLKAGYNTSSDNLTKSVSNTLPKLSEIKKVGRGLYQA